VLYNSLREISSTKGMVLHGYAEHMEAEALLRALQVTGAVNFDWVSGAKKLQEALNHHIEEEESKIFSAAQKLFLDQEAETMGEVFEKMKPAIREGNLAETTWDLMANIMPERLRSAFKGLKGTDSSTRA
jgi:hemerythrin-like domain-containing protein